jgi:hypothetical protein
MGGAEIDTSRHLFSIFHLFPTSTGPKHGRTQALNREFRCHLAREAVQGNGTRVDIMITALETVRAACRDARMSSRPVPSSS